MKQGAGQAGPLVCSSRGLQLSIMSLWRQMSSDPWYEKKHLSVSRMSLLLPVKCTCMLVELGHGTTNEEGNSVIPGTINGIV